MATLHSAQMATSPSKLAFYIDCLHQNLYTCSCILEQAIRDTDLPSITYLLEKYDILGDFVTCQSGKFYAGRDGVSFLNMAISERRIDIVSLLLDHGHYRFSVDVHGRTPLHHAVELGSHEIVVFLSRRGCDIKLMNGVGISCGSWNPNYSFCGVSEPLYFTILDGGPLVLTTGNPRFEYRGNTDVRYVMNGGSWQPQYQDMFNDSFRAMVRLLLLVTRRLSMYGISISNDVICGHVFPLCNWEYFSCIECLEVFDSMRTERAFIRGE